MPCDAKMGAQVVEALVVNKAASATKFISQTLTVRASRRLVDGKVRNDRKMEIVLTIGRPNFEAREFIKQCRRAGEPFPVKKIQFKLPTIK